MEDGFLARFAAVAALLDVVDEDDGGVDHRACEHDERDERDHREILACERQREERAGESDGEDHHDDDGHEEGLELRGQHEVDEADGDDEREAEVGEILHHLGVAACKLGGVAAGEGIGRENGADALCHGARVAVGGVARDGDLTGLVAARDGLRAHDDADRSDAAERHAAAGGRGDGHGAQGVETLLRAAVAAHDHIDLPVVDGDGGGGRSCQAGAHCRGDAVSGQAVLRAGLTVRRHLDLRHLLGDRGGDIHRAGDRRDLRGEVARDHAQRGVVLARDVDAHAAAAHHCAHVIGRAGELAAGDILRRRAHGVGDVRRAARSLAFVDQVEHEAGALSAVGGVIPVVKLGHGLLGDGGDALRHGCGLLDLRADGHGDGYGDHALVHLGQEHHFGVQAGGEKDRHERDGHQHAALEVMDIVIELLNIPCHKFLRAAAALLRPLQRVELHPALVEQEVAQQRHERDGDGQRAENEEDDGQAEVLEDLACDAAGEAQRQKDSHGGERGGGERERDLLRALDAAGHAVVSLGRPAVDVFKHDDGVIDDHADAHGDAAEAHHVERQVAGVHQHEHREDANGHGDRDGHGRAAAAQEQPRHDRREHDAEDDALKRGVDSDIDVFARDIGDGVVNGVVLRGELRHGLDHRLGGLDLVRARALADLQNDARCAVHRGDGVAVGGLIGNGRDLAEAHRAAALERDIDIRHRLDRGELRVGGDGELLAAVVDLTGGVEQVFRLQDLGDVGGGEAVARRALRVERDADAPLDAAGDGDGRHAVDALEGRGDHILRLLLERGEVVAEKADDGARQQLGDIDVENDGGAAALGQAERVELLAQLGRGDVDIGALDIHDLNARDAVGAR